MGDSKNDTKIAETMISALAAVISANPEKAAETGALEKISKLKQELNRLQGGRNDLD